MKLWPYKEKLQGSLTKGIEALAYAHILQKRNHRELYNVCGHESCFIFIIRKTRSMVVEVKAFRCDIITLILIVLGRTTLLKLRFNKCIQYTLKLKRNATIYILVFFYIAHVRIFLKVYSRLCTYTMSNYLPQCVFWF